MSLLDQSKTENKRSQHTVPALIPEINTVIEKVLSVVIKKSLQTTAPSQLARNPVDMLGHQPY